MQRIGAFDYYDPSGRGVKHVPNSTTNYRTDHADTNTAPLIDTQAKIISDYLVFSAYTDFLIDETDILKDPKYDFVREFNPVEFLDKSYRVMTADLRLQYLEKMEQELQADKEKEEIIEGNITAYSQSAVFNFDGFLADLIDIGVDFLLEQVNSLLPAEYQLDVNMEGGEFQGFSVGGIGYNAKQNTITYDGRFFDGLVQDGLDILNDALPDFMPASIFDNVLSIGEISIDLDNLEDGVSMPVLGDISVQNRGGDIIVGLGGKEISVANTAIDLAKRGLDSVFSGGLASINRQLPEGLSVDVQMGDGFLPKVLLGPVSLDTATGALTVDAQALNDLVGSNLNKYVFNQLPAPLGAIARSAWNALDLPQLLGIDGDLVDAPKPVAPPPENIISINNRGQPSLPSIISSPPMIGDFPQRTSADDIA